ncbi:MAG TPA: hypothetical protein VF167_10185 [Longimicrobiaceae bacterium]
MSQVAALRGVIEQRFPSAVPSVYQTTPGVPTGLATLDAALPNGGLPRGRLCVWEPGVGAGAVLRRACAAARERGERAAWIDALGTVSGEIPHTGAVLVRPENPISALVCAEELVRSGGFALVVLAGATSRGSARVRLTRCVREGGTALVELSRETHMAAIRFHSTLVPGGLRWRCNHLGEPVRLAAVTVRVQASALGWSRELELVLPVHAHALRLSLEPSLVDRRGAAR